ncbi:MAG: rod shape-determining protein RodA [Rhodobacterales bacterium]|jgi:rod shape determining protein RodA|nr:rod shape-determining protein RodA [Rhodobacterales bacterium]
MSYLEYNVKYVPSGIRKLLYLNWPLILLVTAVCGLGFLMLYSIAGGSADPWMRPQLQRFGAGFALMMIVALVPIWFWRNMSVLAYLISLALLVAVEFFGEVGMGAQRWLNLGFITIQPSEVAKITLVMVLAAYYDWLPGRKVSHPFWMLPPILLIVLPTVLVLAQPNLGTSVLILVTGATVMFCAGVHWLYFATVIGSVAGAVTAVMQSRGTTWQLLHDYQYRRIDTFLDPTSDPMGAGYNITQATIALGSGGWTGRGFMQGTQSRLNFLPEKQTDFIFNTLAEEFGFIGSMTLLVLYALILIFCFTAAIQQKDKYSALLISGISMSFFMLFAVNMLMVMGLAPVVGVPLPLVSYGGSALMVLLVGFGLIQSAHVHRPR